ncbi:MAG: flagellar basal body rod protein FlgC [Bacillota bacterium]
MKISNNFFGIKMSAAGLSLQRKRMNLISENLANSTTTRTEDGGPYQRKFLVVKQENLPFSKNLEIQNQTLQMAITEPSHIAMTPQAQSNNQSGGAIGLNGTEVKDTKEGDAVYMPEHPDADKDGYVHMPNVNVVTEMVDMIAATRSYESNLTALNSSKQMAKDAMEI